MPHILLLHKSDFHGPNGFLIATANLQFQHQKTPNMEPSSPFEDSGSPEPGYLTPRSKVAKMLADIDNAQTPSPKSSTSRDVSTLAMLSPEQNSSQPGGSYDEQVSNIHDLNTVFIESASDDSDGAVRPRGRAAKRMLGA